MFFIRGMFEVLMLITFFVVVHLLIGYGCYRISVWMNKPTQPAAKKEYDDVH